MVELSTANRQHWRATLVDCLKTFSSVNDLHLARVTFDRASQAGEIARVKWLEHQHHGKTPVALDGIENLMSNCVRRDMEWESHAGIGTPRSLKLLIRATLRVGVLVLAGYFG
jgi:hypothetical protein